MGFLFKHKNESTPFGIDRHWSKQHQQVKSDPYRYILTERQYDGCFNRIKRAIFSGSIVGAYVYYNIRHHQELGLVKGLKFNSVFYLQVVPKVGLFGLITWAIGYSFFVDFDKKRLHEIAKIELQKFDRDYFSYDDYKYVFLNAPIHENSESNFGKMNTFRGLWKPLYQEAGYIKRIKEKNSSVDSDVPPKYDWNTEGPLSNRDYSKITNLIPDSLRTFQKLKH
jgi:hypothetical protein